MAMLTEKSGSSTRQGIERAFEEKRWLKLISGWCPTIDFVANSVKILLLRI
jgi:hypothetical protein